MNSEFGHIRDEEIMRFVRGEMGQKELLVFEKQMKSDTSLQEEVALQKSVYDSLNENEWDTSEMATDHELKEIKDTLKDVDLRRASETIKKVAKTYTSISSTPLKSSKRSYKWLAIAATFLVLLTLPFLFKNQNKDIYTTYENWNELPSFVEKGSDQNALALGEELYKNERYKDVIIHLEKNIDSQSSLYPASLIYLGTSYFKSENEEKALKVFDQLIETKTLYSSYGYWYKLLVYLKKNDHVKTQKMLDIILKDPDNYNFKQATEINAII